MTSSGPGPKTDDSLPALFSLRSHRLKIGLLLMFGLAASVCMRTNLNMAVVCMVNTSVYQVDPRAATSSPAAEECSRSEDHEASKEYKGALEWTAEMQVSLLTATFYGSLVTTALSGSIADRFGPTRILSGACLIYVIGTMATPLLAEHSYHAFFISRIIMGLAEGFVVPSIGSMAGRWFLPFERSTMAGIYTSGNQLGAASSSGISAALCASPLGWHAIFYLFGAAGSVWIVAWLVLASDSPSSNRFISDREAKFLETHQSKSIPWRSMLTCKPMYTCLCCQFAYTFSNTLMQAFLPTYFRDELMIPLATNGLYTMIPFVVQMVMKSLSSIFADALKRKRILEPTAAAKVFQSTCALGITLSLVALAFLPTCEQPWIAAVCLACYGFFFSFGIPGYFTALMSIAPQYSGTMVSMSTVAATFANISCPMLTSLLMLLDIEHIWTLMFSVAGLINLLGGGLFVVFGEAEVQQWANIGDDFDSVLRTEDMTRVMIEEGMPSTISKQSSCGTSR